SRTASISRRKNAGVSRLVAKTQGQQLFELVLRVLSRPGRKVTLVLGGQRRHDAKRQQPQRENGHQGKREHALDDADAALRIAWWTIDAHLCAHAFTVAGDHQSRTSGVAETVTP